ncbi:MAG: hypothetical protein IPJ65_31280 [Archangiaceae bacterium]|nr:hypothetical protein [Archangiaceae bacterium]
MTDKAAPKTFTLVATVEDPLTADRLVDGLTALQIDAFHRGRAGASSDTFGAISRGYYEVLVPTEDLGRAEQVVREELEQVARDEEENAKAAEDESMSKE